MNNRKTLPQSVFFSIKTFAHLPKQVRQTQSSSLQSNKKIVLFVCSDISIYIYIYHFTENKICQFTARLMFVRHVLTLTSKTPKIKNFALVELSARKMYMVPKQLMYTTSLYIVSLQSWRKVFGVLVLTPAAVEPATLTRIDTSRMLPDPQKVFETSSKLCQGFHMFFF